MCVLCSWNQTHLSTFGKETSSSTRMRWQKLHHQGTRPCCPLPGIWTVSPTARTGRAITRPTHRISRVCVCMIDLFSKTFFKLLFRCPFRLAICCLCNIASLQYLHRVLELCLTHMILFYCSIVGLILWAVTVWLLTQIWNAMKWFVTPVQMCVSLLNEQRENILMFCYQRRENIIVIKLKHFI